MRSATVVVLLLVFIPTGAHAQHPDDIFWEPISVSGGQPDGGVQTMVAYGDQLVVGGQFANIGTLPVGYIASWDGTSWSALGTGCDGYVLDLAVYNNQLIAVGSFSSAGGTAASGVAAWDGSTWSPLGTPVGNVSPHLLTVYDGQLYMGVHFSNQVSGELSGYIEVWNDPTWGVIGRFYDWGVARYGYMWDLVADDHGLAVGGWFNVQGTGPEIGPVAVWNGSSWSGRGPTYGHVFSLGHYNGQLINGGWGGVVAWTGSSWSLLGADDIGNPISALGVHNGHLIACGQFGEMGGQAARGIAAYDGVSWSELGSGVWDDAPQFPGEVRAMCTYDNALVVGGSFDGAGGKSIPRLAQWTKTAPVAVAITAFEAAEDQDGIRLSWSLSEETDVDGFHVYRSHEGGGAVSLLNPDLLEPAARGYLDATAQPGVQYRYNLVVVTGGVEDVRSQTITAGRAPLSVRLYQNIPNPFNPTTSIRYVVPSSSRVVLRIYTPSGHLVRTLVNENRPAGVHRATWNGTDSEGAQMASGVYICRVLVGNHAQSIKMTLLK